MRIHEQIHREGDMFTRHLGAACATAVVALAALAPVASAHPIESGEFYVPWGERVGGDRAVDLVRATAAQASAAGTQGLSLVGNADKDGTVNSDLAFNGDLVYAGNYSGFRILDASTPQPTTVVDFACNGPQNDVSFHRMGGKTFLFQSIDTAQTAEDCSSVNAPIVNGGRVGYEGVRVFDVTNPAAPKFIDMIQTACGSHTHTLIPADSQRGDDDDDDDRRAFGARDRDRGSDKAYIYVASYPLTGSSITPPGAVGPGDYRPCVKPHKKISIIEVSSRRGQFSFRLKEQPLGRRHAVAEHLRQLPGVP